MLLFVVAVRAAPIVVTLNISLFLHTMHLPNDKFSELIDGRHLQTAITTQEIMHHIDLEIADVVIGIVKKFTTTGQALPRIRILLYLQLVFVMFQPSRCSKHLPINQHQRIVFELLQPVLQIRMLVRHEELVQV